MNKQTVVFYFISWAYNSTNTTLNSTSAKKISDASQLMKTEAHSLTAKSKKISTWGSKNIKNKHSNKTKDPLPSGKITEIRH